MALYNYRTESGKLFKSAEADLNFYLNIQGVGYFYYRTAKEAMDKLKEVEATYSCIVGTVTKL